MKNVVLAILMAFAVPALADEDCTELESEEGGCITLCCSYECEPQ